LLPAKGDFLEQNNPGFVVVELAAPVVSHVEVYYV
jgi:hypothetical protein